LATLAAIPHIAFCREKKALADLLVEATRELFALHHAKAQALTQGVTLERFDIAIGLAREKKDVIKLAYQLHVNKHGC
jgi:hypothetical protein